MMTNLKYVSKNFMYARTYAHTCSVYYFGMCV